MANNPASRLSAPLTTKFAPAEIDAGLRQFLLSVYNYMALGLALTRLIAYAAAESGLLIGLVTPTGFEPATIRLGI